MRNYEKVPIEILEDHFKVNFRTGIVFRKSGSNWLVAGFVKKGSRANGGGYVIISVPLGGGKYTHLRAHQIIWILAHGVIPDGYEVDHKNGKRSDNRLTNLRLATVSENRINSVMKKNNKSGYKWVHWCNQKKKYTGAIGNPAYKPGNGKPKRLFTFDHSDPRVVYDQVCLAAKKIYGAYFNDGSVGEH